VRAFKNLVTDIQSVYRDAKNDLLRSLKSFDQSLQDARGKLLIRLDKMVSILTNAEEGISSRSLESR